MLCLNSGMEVQRIAGRLTHLGLEANPVMMKAPEPVSSSRSVHFVNFPSPLHFQFVCGSVEPSIGTGVPCPCDQSAMHHTFGLVWCSIWGTNNQIKYHMSHAVSTVSLLLI